MEILLKLRYIINDSYNAYYIKKMKIVDTEPVPVESFKNNSNAITNASPFMTVWLLNINRIIAASKILPSNYDFLDVGCGKAISTIYVKKKYNFNSVNGFDFESCLIKGARKNIESSNEKDINLLEADATKIRLENKQWFIFMFNPFDAIVMEEFIRNNIDVLRTNKSVLGYANAREMDTIKKFEPQRIVEMPSYKCSVVFF